MPRPSRPAHLLNPLHPRFIGVGAALLIAAFVTDLLYWRTALPEWETFSIWLLTGGLVLAALSAVALVLDVLLHQVMEISRWRFAALAGAVVISILNAFVHSRDGYTAVVPQGLGLSAIATVLLLVAGWRGWSLAEAPSSQAAASHGARS